MGILYVIEQTLAIYEAHTHRESLYCIFIWAAITMEKPFPEILKERSSMKCPVCGNKLKKASRCDNCGNDMSRPHNGFEVEYKEFPVSELLEIRQKPQAVRPQRNGGSDTHATLTEARGTRGSISLRGKKALFHSIVILLIVLTVIIGVLLLTDFSP
jgi:hypothetical protein